MMFLLGYGNDFYFEQRRLKWGAWFFLVWSSFLLFSRGTTLVVDWLFLLGKELNRDHNALLLLNLIAA
uniref:Putative secreted protein n=1 Tax=Panstrongylus lignarius TaxID=156445 RepID=A0A224Y705_9HEMI